MPLPFLIVHGAGLWKLVLIGFVLLCVGVVLLLRRLDAQRSARKATQWVELEAGELVRGTLGGGSITTLILDRNQAVNHRDPELWIETTDGRVPLVGDDIRAVSGSRMSQKRNGAPKRTPTSMFDDAAVHRPRLRARTITIASLFELVPGDHVIARGALVREPGTQATDYRESVTTLSLHGPIMIGATTPRGVAARPSWIALAMIAGVVGLIGYKIESGLGDSWRRDCFDLSHLDDHGPRPLELSNTHACVLANAMPNEPYVLDQLVDEFARSPIKSDAELGQHVLLARTVGGCKSSLELLEKLAQPDALLAETMRCGDRKHQQLALTELGRFDEAAKLSPLEDHTGALYILGREWGAAAKLAEQHAHDAETGEKPSPDDARQWRCLAELMRYYGGDQGARARVQKLAPGDDSPCRVELAEMTLGAEHERLLLLGASDAAARRALQALSLDEVTALSVEQVLSGRPALRQDAIGTYLARGSSELSMVSGAAIWATAVAPEPSDVTEPLLAPGQGRYAYYITRIISRVHDGDLLGAHHDADRAIAIAKTSEYSIYAREELGIIHALIDLYGQSTTTPFEPASTANDEVAVLRNFLMPHILFRHGLAVDEKQWIGGDLQPLEAAANGDATKLVEGLTGEYSNWTQLDVLSVLPRVTTKRAELVAAMRWGGTANEHMIGYGFPWSSIGYAAERRTLFDLGGDHDEAARWAASYARYRKALTDRKSLIALALWNRF